MYIYNCTFIEGDQQGGGYSTNSKLIASTPAVSGRQAAGVLHAHCCCTRAHIIMEPPVWSPFSSYYTLQFSSWKRVQRPIPELSF